MFGKGTKIYSIFTGVCPQCHKESMYENKNPYQLTKVLKMNERCSHCDLQYQIEPSFFYGAMYVSYALNVALGIATFIICYFMLTMGLKNIFISIVVSQILLAPIVMRISRNIYINMFVHYKSEE